MSSSVALVYHLCQTGNQTPTRGNVNAMCWKILPLFSHLGDFYPKRLTVIS